MRLITFQFTAGLFAACALGQGTFRFDQQSSTDESLPVYGEGAAMQAIGSPWGQSFTPALSSVEFIRLKLLDGNVNDGLGATVYLNLRSGSISGPTIGVTTPTSMPTLFRGTVDFLFSSPIALVPGTTYYFEPVVASGGRWNIISGPFGYSGGTAIENGLPIASDAWFREGIFVPEPSVSALLALALALRPPRRAAVRPSNGSTYGKFLSLVASSDLGPQPEPIDVPRFGA